MAELLTMYPAQANSPETTLAGSLSATSTSATVLDGSVLPDAPNYLTIGADTTSAETVLMTAKSGNVLTITRGQNGTAARAWDKGDIIARYFTAADHDAIRENISRLNNGKPDKVEDAVDGNFAAFGEDGGLVDSGKKPSDFAAANHSHNDKADKVEGAVDGNLAGLDESGNITDSGKKPGDFAAANHSHNDKADKVEGAVDGNLAGLDESGNITDSGKKPGDFAAANHSHNDKADKVEGAVDGNLAGLDESGNITDSGKKPGDFAAANHGHSGYALVKYFQNVAVPASAWVSSSTKPAYPYQAEISAAGVDSSWKPDITFSDDDAESGNFSSSANAGTNTVIIYAASKPTTQITILTIECKKAVT